MTNEQREAIDRLKKYIEEDDFYNIYKEIKEDEREGKIGGTHIVFCKAIDIALSLIKEQEKQIDLIKEYAHQEIVNYTETIRDYIDDDKEGNKDYIGELKEDREHWKDIEKILQNKPKEELYMNWWRYGLYE